DLRQLWVNACCTGRGRNRAACRTPNVIDIDWNREGVHSPDTNLVPTRGMALALRRAMRSPVITLAVVIAISAPLHAQEQKPPVELPAEKPADPFAFADFSWIPGNYGAPDRPLTAGPFTGELRVDTVYHYEFSNPKDNTISGSSEVFRSNEVQV